MRRREEDANDSKKKTVRELLTKVDFRGAEMSPWHSKIVNRSKQNRIFCLIKK